MAATTDQVSATMDKATTSSSAPEPSITAEDATKDLTTSSDEPGATADAALKADDAPSSNGPTAGQDSANGHTEGEKPALDLASASEPPKEDEPGITDAVNPIGTGESAPQEKPVTTGAIPSQPEVATESAAAVADAAPDAAAEEGKGSEEDVAVGDKRKADEPAPENGETKKAKTEEATEGDSVAKKPGRPAKKDQRAKPVPQQTNGKTLRKTRSQGPVEA
ncbi:hypothetical protein DL546_007921 [Coniochaeta pulveracea]|uniref:Uncharacterized protein n=1 Tax=Coniochaeta pulveracea TaxID=177199 RepID=A0A420YEF0_9PEZI|nr:hypothetical protein DL546_007921 [Coniochaeta pulveracea]